MRRQSVHAVRLFLDDLQYIEAVVRGRGFQATWRDHDFEYDGLEEIAEHRGDRLSTIELAISTTTERPFLADDPELAAEVQGWEREVERVGVVRLGEWANVELDDPDALGPDFDRIVDRLETRQTFLGRIGGWGPGGAFVLGGALAVYAVLLARDFIPAPSFGWQLLIGLLGGLAGMFGLGMIESARCGVFLRKSHEGGFLKRNRDALAVNIIIAVVTAVVTWAVTRATTTDTASHTDNATSIPAAQSAPANRSAATP